MSLEKRKTSRFPVLSMRQEGELRFGKIRMPVRLLDQSASGIAVMAKQSPGVEVGTTGLLRAEDDWFKIRLVNIVPMEPSASKEISTPEVQIQRFRLGLFRLCDTIDPDKKHLWRWWPSLRIHLDTNLSTKTTVIGFGMLFAISVVVLPVLTILFMQNSYGISGDDLIRFVKRIVATDNSGSNQTPPSTSAELAPSVNPSENTSTGSTLADLPKELGNIIRRNPGASVFLAPEVVRQLDITKKQRLQLQQVVDATAEIVNDLEAKFKRKISPKQHQELLKVAQNSALQLLTEKQRSEWRILSGEKPQDKNVPEIKDGK